MATLVEHNLKLTYKDGKSGNRDKIVKTIFLDEIDRSTFINEMPTIVDNLVNGTAEDDVLLGENSLSNSINADAGDDLLIGFDNLDFLSGEEGNDFIVAGRGSDRLFGGSGSDFLFGGDGNDNLRGDSGKDVLLGNEGADFLRGDNGKDLLVGGEGSDVFILQPGQGTDIITDFEDGIDSLGLSILEPDFNEIQVAAKGEDTTIGDGNRVFALLKDVDANTIGSEDFVEVEIAV